MAVGIFLDLSDLYHRVNRKFGKKLNFSSVLEVLNEEGDVEELHAYGIQRNNEASGFITCLQRLGFQTHFKYPEIIRCGGRELKRSNWECGIACDVFRFVQTRLEIFKDEKVILGTGSNIMSPLAKYLTETDLECVVLCCGVGKELRHHASRVIEITEDLLE
jgi:hypothetical protein